MEFKKTNMKVADFGSVDKAVRLAVTGTGKCLQLSEGEKAANKAAEFFANAAIEAVKQGFDLAPDGGTMLSRRAWREAQLAIDPANWIRNSRGNVVAIRGKAEKALSKQGLVAAVLAAAAKEGLVAVELCTKVQGMTKTELLEMLKQLRSGKKSN